MKTAIGSVFVFCLILAPASLAQSRHSTEQQILPLLHQQSLAANAHDTERFLASFLHSDALIFAINGQVIHGWNSLHEQQLRWWRSGKSDVVYTEQGPPDFVSLGPKAVLVTQQMASHRTLPNGKPSDGTFVVTTVWQRLPAGWRVIYGHESWAR
ncbi:MAG TPA: nuclear transport factor 2 family protein [Terracidiphilus sp.]|jgi:ketosteroid isomerase-like protein|nr:nuclear transport factor 2 family protein [Terracidiphilus sp.]